MKLARNDNLPLTIDETILAALSDLRQTAMKRLCLMVFTRDDKSSFPVYESI